MGIGNIKYGFYQRKKWEYGFYITLKNLQIQKHGITFYPVCLYNFPRVLSKKDVPSAQDSCYKQDQDLLSM